MFRRSLLVVVLLLAVFAVSCQTAETEVVEVPVEVEVTRIVEVPVEVEPAAAAPGLSPMMPVEFDTFNSSIMGRDYALTVALPMSYGMTEVDYPVIYVTDGDIYAIPLASATSQMAFGQEVPEFIIVGVDYGVADPMQWLGLREEDMAGNREQYQKFFAEELVPYIENIYRANPDMRTLAGHSSGGDFALYSLLNGGAATFDNFIASAPSTAASMTDYLDNFAANQGQTAANLYLSAGELDEETVTSVEAFNGALSEMNFEGLAYELQILDNETHLSSRPRAFNNAVRWIVANEGL